MSPGSGDATIGLHGSVCVHPTSSSSSSSSLQGHGQDVIDSSSRPGLAGSISQSISPGSAPSSSAVAAAAVPPPAGLPSHRHLPKLDAARRSTSSSPSSSSLSSLHMHQERMKRGPFGDADGGVILAATALEDDSNRILGKRPAPSPPSPTTTSRSWANQVAYSRPARQTRRIARQLLEMVTCPSCNRPYTTPVTLPCGHSICLPCISARLHKIAVANQGAAGPSTRTTHVPPRLPLCTMTVPCSISGCPRSAIGQGLGVWAGYSAAYNLPDSEAWVDDDASGPGSNADEARMQSSSVERGCLPVDGFVVGAENESLRLGVIPPQLREKANVFAISPFPWEGEAGNSLSLRPDVTLAKVVAVLQRYAQEPPPPGEEDRRNSPNQRARRPLRGFATARRHGAHGYGLTSSRSPAFGSHASSAPSSASHRRTRTSSSFLARGTGNAEHTLQRNGRAAPSTRPGATKIARHFRSMLGGSEADRESGSVAGVIAADSEDDLDDEEDQEEKGGSVLRRFSSNASRRRAGTLRRSYRLASAEDDEDAADGQGSDDDFEQARGADVTRMGNGDHSHSNLTHDTANATGDRFDGAFRSELERQEQNGLRTPSEGGARDAPIAPAEAPLSNSPIGTTTGTVASTLEKLEEVFKLTTPEHLHSDLVDTLECQLCYFLLYEPTTTPCGHTFCRGCFTRSLDHSSKCPLCRATVPSFAFFQNHPRNQSLMSLLTSQCGAPVSTDRGNKDGDSGRDQREESASSTFPQEELMSLSRLGVFADSYSASTSPSPAHRSSDDDDEEILSFGLRHLYNERAQTIEEEERRTSSWMPIFVCTLAFPTMPTNLHIFEPRYKLMVRRCLQGGGPARFGMVLPSRSATGPVPGLYEYGTMLEIKNHNLLLNGRSMLETVGWRRFKLLETSSLDGYTTGRVEYFDDVSPSEVALEEAAVVASNRQALARRDVQMHMHRQQMHTQMQMQEDVASPTTSTGLAGTPSTTTVTPGSHSASGTASIDEGGMGVQQDPFPPSNASLHPASSTLLPVEQAPIMSDLIRTATSFIELLRTQTQPGLFEQIVATYGPVPQPLEVDKLSWWLGMVLPIDEHAKSTLLPVRSPRKRLEMIVRWIERIEGSRRAER